MAYKKIGAPHVRKVYLEWDILAVCGNYFTSLLLAFRRDKVRRAYIQLILHQHSWLDALEIILSIFLLVKNAEGIFWTLSMLASWIIAVVCRMMRKIHVSLHFGFGNFTMLLMFGCSKKRVNETIVLFYQKKNLQDYGRQRTFVVHVGLTFKENGTRELFMSF